MHFQFIRRRVSERTGTMAASLRAATAFCALVVLVVFAGAARPADTVTPQAQAVSKVLDAMGVESKWIAGEHVYWETGLPTGVPETSPGKHTHCSAFVAAAAKNLGVYILRPPEHGQKLLANAQSEWLAEEGAARGWVRRRCRSSAGRRQSRAARGGKLPQSP
jgi:hypothetical protein